MRLDEINPADLTPPASDSKLDQLNQMSDEVTGLAEAIEETKAALEALQKRYSTLTIDLMPDLMAEIGLGKKFERNGMMFTLGVFASGGWPKDPERAQVALEWLEANDMGGMVKTEVKATFGKGDIELAKEVFAAMEGLCDPLLESKVHPQTLQAMVRRRLRDGQEIDPPLLGLFAGRRVSVKKLKEK